MEYFENKSSLLKYHPNNTIKEAYSGKTVSVQISYVHHSLFGRIRHLWIRRHDEKPMGWSQLQRIKNELIGDEKMAIQVFPKTSELTDQANMYHLWVFDNFSFEINENGFKF